MRDDTSYEEYVTGRWPALFRLAYLLTGAEAPAEDLLQSVLLRASRPGAGSRGWSRRTPTCAGCQ